MADTSGSGTDMPSSGATPKGSGVVCALGDRDAGSVSVRCPRCLWRGLADSCSVIPANGELYPYCPTCGGPTVEAK